jgi:hypothetical protein
MFFYKKIVFYNKFFRTIKVPCWWFFTKSTLKWKLYLLNSYYRVIKHPLFLQGQFNVSPSILVISPSLWTNNIWLLNPSRFPPLLVKFASPSLGSFHISQKLWSTQHVIVTLDALSTLELKCFNIDHWFFKWTKSIFYHNFAFVHAASISYFVNICSIFSFLFF